MSDVATPVRPTRSDDQRRLAVVLIGCQSTEPFARGHDGDGWRAVVRRCLDAARDAQALVFHVQLLGLPVTASPSWRELQSVDPSFRFPADGSEAAEYWAEARPVGNEPSVECYRPSALLDTRLPLLLRSNEVTDLVLVGPVVLPSILPSAVTAACMDFRVSVLVEPPDPGGAASARAAHAALSPWARVLTEDDFMEMLTSPTSTAVGQREGSDLR